MDFNAIAELFRNIIFFALHLGSPNLFPKPLPKKEETELIRRMCDGNEDAKKKLIEHNLRLIVHIIKIMNAKQVEYM